MVRTLIALMLTVSVVMAPSASNASFIPKPPTRPLQYPCNPNMKDEAVCLACNFYHEARGEDDYGVFLVGMVTRNRVIDEKHPDTFCKTVWQKIVNRWGKLVAMYSWTLDDIKDVIPVSNRNRWNRLVGISNVIVQSYYDQNTDIFDPTHGALCYHSVSIKRPPTWKKKDVVLKHNNHIFYKKC